MLIFHFSVQEQNLWNGPLPRYDIWWKFLKFYFVCTVQWCMQIGSNPFSYQPFENVNILFSYWKCMTWNGCNVFNIAGNTIKDINVNLSFCSSGSKVVEWTPLRIWHLVEFFLNSFLSSGSKVEEWTPPRSDMWWKLLKFYFHLYCPMMHANWH